MTPRVRNILIALCFAILAGGWGWHQQVAILRQRAQCTAAEAALAEVQRQQAEAAQRLESLRENLASERAQRDAALVATAVRSRPSIKNADGSDPAQPPATLPAWDSTSPYVWLRKEELSRLGVHTFTPDGSLTPELATLLDIQPAAQKAISDKARRLLAEWRTSEAQLATRSDQHPSNIGKSPGPTVTVRVPPQPELAARLRQEFRDEVTGTVGEQRARLLLGFARDDIRAELGPEPEPNQPPVRTKTYSVRRDGHNYQVVVNIPSGSSMSTSSPEWRGNIPAHLHSFFEETFGPPEGH